MKTYSVQDLRVGDRVRKANGKKVGTVCYKSYPKDTNMRIEWDDGKTQGVFNYEYTSWVKLEEEEVMTAEALYEVTLEGKTSIAKKLMEKTPTMWIMEVKGKDNEVIVVDKKFVSEILPYTIKVLMDGRETSYRVDDESKYEVDDVFLMGKTLSLARVLSVDTKDKTARGVFKPFAKLQILKDF